MVNYTIEINYFNSQEIRGEIKSKSDIIEIFNQLSPLIKVEFNKVKLKEDIFKEILFYNEFDLNFTECELDLILFFEFKGNKVRFNNCEFGDNVFISKSVNGKIEFRNQNIDSINFDNLINSIIEISSCEINQVSIENSECPIILVGGDSIINELEIDDCKINKLNLFSSKINELDIELSKIDKITIADCLGETLTILDDSDSGINELVDVIILNCNYKLIKINGDTVRKSLLRDIIMVNTSNFEIGNVSLNSLSLNDGVLENIRIISAEINDFIILNVYLKDKVEFIFVSVFKHFAAYAD